MRKVENINQRIITWSNNKPQNKLYKKYMTDGKEEFHQDIGSKRVKSPQMINLLNNVHEKIMHFWLTENECTFM